MRNSIARFLYDGSNINMFFRIFIFRLVYNRKILLIRPKTALADNGNYRESRWYVVHELRCFSLEKEIPELYAITSNKSTTCILMVFKFDPVR